MGKGARNRSKRNRQDFLKGRTRKTFGFFKNKLDAAYEKNADEFVNRIREARAAVPGATQEVPVVKENASPDGESKGTDYAAMTRDQLRTLAADYGIRGRGKMSKTELIRAVENAASGG